MNCLADLDKETVDFVPNYDESEREPAVLPTRIPNLLINGSAGIAVGMATNIPPHNLTEVIGACLALIDDPDISYLRSDETYPGAGFSDLRDHQRCQRHPRGLPDRARADLPARPLRVRG